jgi:cephalosporin hydroxylase
MGEIKFRQLDKLYGFAKRGSRGFRDDSVKPHMDIFAVYASKCVTITELGIDSGCSTLAFLNSGCKKVYSYNVVISSNALKIKQAAREDGMFFKLISKDNLKVKIKKTDLLFIDTDHWYGQIKAELEHHHPRVNKWIMMHDTETFSVVNPFDGRPGMRAAIYEFLEVHPEWKIKEHFEIGHGLTVLERQSSLKRKWWLFG